MHNDDKEGAVKPQLRVKLLDVIARFPTCRCEIKTSRVGRFPLGRCATVIMVVFNVFA